MTPRRFPAGTASVGTSATADADGAKRAAPAGPTSRRAAGATRHPPAAPPDSVVPAPESVPPPPADLPLPEEAPGEALTSLPPTLPAVARMAAPRPVTYRQSGEVATGRGRTEGTPRTFTIMLPAGLALLSLNDRGHWAARYRRSEALKKAAWALALQQKIPRLERVSVVAEYQPGDLRRRDPDNIAVSAKAAIDGLRAARVLAEDDSSHVAEVVCRIGPMYPKGRLVLTLTEVAL